MTDTVVQAARGAYGAIVEFPIPIKSDNCGADFVNSHQPGDFFPCGETIVTINAIDSAGNSSETCAFTVRVDCDLDIDFAGVQCGMAVTTRYSGDRAANDPLDNVIDIIDVRSRDFPPLNQDISDQFNIINDPRWTAFNIGEVFGTAIDDQDFIYVTSTTIYPENYFGANQENTGGEIYRIDPDSGDIELFQRLPNTGQGLGNICFASHNGGRYLYVTNWENGFIYQIDLDGWNGNPDARGNYEHFDIFQMDVDSLGYAPLGQLTWGIGYNPIDKRLYFSRWMQNGGELGTPNNCNTCQDGDADSGLGPNTIHSVSLDNDGQIILDSLRLDVTLDRIYQLTGLDTLISNPISDIAFSSVGNMLISERAMCCPDESGAGRARVIEYEFGNGTWITTADKSFYVGSAGSNNATNAAGGLDYGYAAGFDNDRPEFLPKCDSTIWVTADINTYDTYGVVGLPARGNNSTDPESYYIDLSDNSDDSEHRMIGDVEIFKCGCPIPSVAEFCDSLSITMNTLGEPDSCCWSLDILNRWEEQNITRIEAEIITPGLIYSEVITDQGFVVDAANGNAKNLASIRFQNNNIPTDDFIGALNFCFAGGQANSGQQVMFRWYEQLPGLEEQLVCTEVLSSSCNSPIADSLCISVFADSVFCDTLDLFTYQFQISNESNRSITAINLYPDSLNSNFQFEPSTLNLTSPLAAGQASDLLTVTILSDTVVTDTTPFDFNIVAFHNDNQYYCSDLDSLNLLLLPCCLSCDAAYVQIDELNSDTTTCCYSLDIFNVCPENQYQKIELEILTPDAAFGSIYTDGENAQEWNNPIIDPTKVQWMHESGNIPIGVSNNLINFCLDSIATNVPDSVAIAIRWLGSQDSIACVDTLFINCQAKEKACASIVNDTVSYTGNGTFHYSVSFVNESAPFHTSSNIQFISLSPDSICIEPMQADSLCAPVELSCITNSIGEVCTHNFNISNATPGDTLRYLLSLSDSLNANNGWLWQCFEYDTFEIVLPIVPIIECPDDIILTCCGSIDLPVPILSDTTGNAQIICNRTDGKPLTDPFTKGTTQIICVSSNDFGQMDSCSYNIIVTDTLAPMIQCPMNRDTIFTDLTCIGVPLPDYTNNLVLTDSCIMDITIIQSPAPGTFLMPGKYDVQFSAVDVCLNVGNCSFEVAVICDADPPCDSLVVDYVRDETVPDSCCYEITLSNVDDGFYPALEIHAPSPTVISSINPLNNWSTRRNPGSDTVILIPPVTPIDVRDLGPIVRICTDGFNTEPHPVYLDWLSQGIDDDLFVVCTDTLNFECDTTKCCQDQPTFVNRVNAVEITSNVQDCYIQVSWSGLGECDRIIWEWGDSTVSGYISVDSTLFHTYENLDTYEVCYTIEETTRSGAVCWSSPTFCLRDRVNCETSLQTCEPCDDNSIISPNLINNGDFNITNGAIIESAYTFIPNGEILSGQYGVRNSLALENDQWAVIDHTTGAATGQFMVVNAVRPDNNLPFWRDSIPISPNRKHTFCAYVNNLILPEIDVRDPFVEVKINGRNVINRTAIAENPDLWLLITGDWVSAPGDSAAIIEIFSPRARGTGHQLAIDDISFYECVLDTCEANFEFELAFDNGNNNCGTVNFTNQSGGLTNLTYLWEFGDDSTSIQLNPTHRYEQPGSYTACLTIQSERNCTNTFCQDIVIDFSNAPPTITCPDNLVLPATTDNCEAIFDPIDPMIGISLCSSGAEVECFRDDGLDLNAPYPVGNTLITCTVKDNFGEASCSYIISVTDENCDQMCCMNQTNFENRVQDGFTYRIDNCDLTITPNNLNECHRVIWSWGDGSNNSRTTGTMPITHSYLDSGELRYV